MKQYIILLGLIPLISGCSYLDRYLRYGPHDEVVEEVVEYKTDLSIDLTPER